MSLTAAAAGGRGGLPPTSSLDRAIRLRCPGAPQVQRRVGRVGEAGTRSTYREASDVGRGGGRGGRQETVLNVRLKHPSVRVPLPLGGPATVLSWRQVMRAIVPSPSGMAGAHDFAMRPIASRATTGPNTTQPLPSSASERARAPCHTPHARSLGSAPGNLHQERPPGAQHRPHSTRDENGVDNG